MANTNTFAKSPATPAAAQVINASTETVLVAAGAPISVGLSPNSNFADAQPFIVRLRGIATGGTSATLALKLYIGTSATVGSDSAVAAFTVSGAAIPVGGGHFDVSVSLQWDAVTGEVNGITGGHTNGTVSTAAVTAQAVATVQAFQFIASATFGAALATNSVTVTEFIIDQA